MSGQKGRSFLFNMSKAASAMLCCLCFLMPLQEAAWVPRGMSATPLPTPYSLVGAREDDESK